MKTCSRCGFSGDLTHCPNDGEVLLDDSDLASRAAPEPTQAPPPVPRRAHGVVPKPVDTGAETMADSDPDVVGLRDAQYGKWAEPEVKKKQGDPMIGRVVSGRYEVLSLLGQGGMGAVYKAREANLRRVIALKILLKDFAENETVVRRFHQEALAASRLTHPNTIRVIDFGQDGEDGLLYMAMEFLRGVSLAQELTRGGPMSPRRAVYIMRQMCKSLAEAHKAGIIHRDLKPDNIFLVEIEGERDFVKVLDFGVAKLKDKESGEGTLTQAGMIFGTPKYMSPEQARSASLDPRSDVYALGVILYEMLTGRPPFSGDNPLAVLIAHVNEQPKRFIVANPNVQVPTPLEAVVFRALAKEREDRQASVDALLLELEAVDELLQGASWESLSDRLPQMLPGADGDPSLVGPAILPAGSSGTLPGQGLGGGTIRLDANGQPLPPLGGPSGSTLGLAVGELAVPVDETPPRRNNTAMIALAALLVPLGAAGAWFALGNSDPPSVDPTLAASNGPPSEAPTTSPPTLAAATEPPRPQLPGSGADDGLGKSCLIATDPVGVKVFTTDVPEQLVGVTRTGLAVRIKAPTRYALKLTGYKDQTIDLDPKADPCFAQVKMRAVPGAISRPTPPSASPGGSTIVIGGGGTAPATGAPRPPPPSTKASRIEFE